jgi:uncharacterized protein (UPF0264 family)
MLGTTHTSQIFEGLPGHSGQAPRGRRLLGALWVATLVALALGGCQRQKTRDCAQFVTSVNDVLTAIDRHISEVDGGELTNVEDMRKLAGYYDTLADRIGKLDLSTPELVKQAQSYRVMVKTAARTAKLVADALAAEDLEKALSAQNQFTTVVADEDKVVQRINAFCAAP